MFVFQRIPKSLLINDSLFIKDAKTKFLLIMPAALTFMVIMARISC